MMISTMLTITKRTTTMMMMMSGQHGEVGGVGDGLGIETTTVAGTATTAAATMMLPIATEMMKPTVTKGTTIGSKI